MAGAVDVGMSLEGVHPRHLAVRAATLDDVEAIARMHARATCKLEQECARRVHLELSNPDKHLVVATAHGEVVGWGRACHLTPGPFAAPNAAPEGWYLMGVHVEPSWRRCGLGAALTAARMLWIAQRASSLFYVADPNSHATVGLHELFGFDSTGREVRVDRDLGELFLRHSMQLHEHALDPHTWIERAWRLRERAHEAS